MGRLDNTLKDAKGDPDTNLADMTYSGWREKGHEVLEGHILKSFMGFVILLNAIQVVYESDVGSACQYDNDKSACDQEAGWLLVTNWIYLILYSIEMVLRIYVHRVRCLCDAWDIFDATIIFIGILSETLGGALPSTGILRLFRLARLVRAIKFIKLPKELHIMIHGFVSALFAISIGAILVFLMLTLWSVVAVALFNDPNHDEELILYYSSHECEWGPKAWSSVANSIFTFAQLLIMGEGWACNAIPLIERNPWSLVLFVMVFFTVVLGMTNLILAVIVDKALQNHEADIKRQAKERKDQKDKAVEKFVKLCRGLDVDQSGSVSFEEMMNGYADLDEFRDTMDVLDIGKDDLELLYKMMDRDKSGDVSYEEFGHELVRIKNESIQTLISFTKHHVIETQIVVNSIQADLEKLTTGIHTPRSVSKVSHVSDQKMLENASRQDIGGIQQLRESIQQRAVDACNLLEKQALALVDSERCAAEFVAALRATVPRKPDNILSTMDVQPLPIACTVDDRQPTDRPNIFGSQEPKADQRQDLLLLEELRQMEDRLMKEFASLTGEVGTLTTSSKQKSCKYLCLPSSARIDENNAPMRRV